MQKCERHPRLNPKCSFRLTFLFFHNPFSSFENHDTWGNSGMSAGDTKESCVSADSGLLSCVSPLFILFLSFDENVLVNIVSPCDYGEVDDSFKKSSNNVRDVDFSEIQID